MNTIPFKRTLLASGTALALCVSPSVAEARWQEWLLNLFSGPPKNYGVWLCSSCSIPAPNEPTSVQAMPDIAAFIHDQNDSIHAGERVARWSPNSYITVCDANNCLTVYYQAATDIHLPKAPAFRNIFTTYKNSSAIPRITPVGGKTIVAHFNGPAPSLNGSFSLDFYYSVVGGTSYLPAPIPARTAVITVGPLVTVGPSGEYTDSFEDSIRQDLGPYQDGGNGGGCVQVDTLLPDGKRAGDVKVGDVLELGDDQTMESATGVVSYSVRKVAKGFRVVTSGGASLVCSDSAPIATRGGLILAPNLLGKEIAVRTDSSEGKFAKWEKVSRVEEVGLIEIQHITVGDKCFWAGERFGRFILHHNLKCADCGGSGGNELDWLWD